MKEVETEFAADSCGFTTCKFTRWFDVKYGVTREKAEWVKAHIMTGVKTNVITAVEIHGKDAADVTQVARLLEATAKGFKVVEVSADKAYTATDCFQAVSGRAGSSWTIEVSGIRSYYARNRDMYRPPPDLYRRLDRWLGPAATSLGLGPRDVILLEVPGRRDLAERPQRIERRARRPRDKATVSARSSSQSLGPLAAETHRCAADDRCAMAEPGSLE